MRKKTRARKFSLRKVLLFSFGSLAQIFRWTFPLAGILLVFLLSFQGLRRHLFADELFSLSFLDIQTDGVLTSGEIARIAGLKLGDNILALNLEAVTRKIELDRRVRQATISRMLPNRIAIRIQERREFLRIKMPAQGGFYVMDEEGYLLGAAREDSTLLIFEDRRAGAQGVFSRDRYRDLRLLRIVFAIKNLIGEEPILQSKKGTRMEVESMEKINIYFDDGFEIKVGKDYRRDFDKVKVIRPLLEKEIENLHYLDLRFENVTAKRKDKNKKGR